MFAPPATPSEAAARELLVACVNQMAVPGFLFNPLNMARARLQLQPAASPSYSGVFDCLRTIAQNDGALSLYKYGVAMSMLREFSYGGLQWGLYTPIKSWLGGESVTVKLGAGLLSGAFSSCFVAPVDQLMLRQYFEGGRVNSEGVYTTGLRAGHAPSASSSLQMLSKIYEEGGIAGVFRGTSMTICRAALITVGLTAGYDQTKEEGKKRLAMREGTSLHLLASISAGVCASISCAPFDVLKSRIMVEPHKYPNGLWQCLQEVLKSEGVSGLFVGVRANVLRLCPMTAISMPIMEWMRHAAGCEYFGVVASE